MLVIIDDWSIKVMVHYMKNKLETPLQVEATIEQAETQAGAHVQRICAGSGDEFIVCTSDDFLQSKGIMHEKMVPYCPERMNQTLLDTAWMLLTDAKLLEESWTEGANVAACVGSTCSNRVLQGAIPSEVYTSRRQTVAYFMVFGCQAYAQVAD